MWGCLWNSSRKGVTVLSALLNIDLEITACSRVVCTTTPWNVSCGLDSCFAMGSLHLSLVFYPSGLWPPLFLFCVQPHVQGNLTTEFGFPLPLLPDTKPSAHPGLFLLLDALELMMVEESCEFARFWMVPSFCSDRNEEKMFGDIRGRVRVCGDFWNLT